MENKHDLLMKQGIWNPAIFETIYGGIGCSSDIDGTLKPCSTSIPENENVHYFEVEAFVQIQRWDLSLYKNRLDIPNQDLTETNWNRLSLHSKRLWNVFVQNIEPEIKDQLFTIFCNGNIDDMVYLTDWEWKTSFDNKPRIELKLKYGPTNMTKKKLTKEIRDLFKHYRWSGYYSFVLKNLVIIKKYYNKTQYLKKKVDFLTLRRSLANVRLKNFETYRQSEKEKSPNNHRFLNSMA